MRRSDEKHREQRRAYKAQHYQENKPKYVEWARRCDPEAKRAAKNRRRARILGNGFVKYNPKEIFERDKNACRYCGDVAKHLDHIIPIFRGGTDTPENVVASCARCNHRKGKKTATEFMRPRLEELSRRMGRA